MHTWVSTNKDFAFKKFRFNVVNCSFSFIAMAMGICLNMNFAFFQTPIRVNDSNKDTSVFVKNSEAFSKIFEFAVAYQLN